MADTGESGREFSLSFIMSILVIPCAFQGKTTQTKAVHSGVQAARTLSSKTSVLWKVVAKETSSE